MCQESVWHMSSIFPNNDSLSSLASLFPNLNASRWFKFAPYTWPLQKYTGATAIIKLTDHKISSAKEFFSENIILNRENTENKTAPSSAWICCISNMHVCYERFVLLWTRLPRLVRLKVKPIYITRTPAAFRLYILNHGKITYIRTK